MRAGILSVDCEHAALRVRTAAVRGADARRAGRRVVAQLLLGYVVMLPFIAWGVIADFLKNVAITERRRWSRRKPGSRRLTAIDRVCLPVRITDSPRSGACRRVGADAPCLPRAVARACHRCIGARDAASAQSGLQAQPSSSKELRAAHHHRSRGRGSLWRARRHFEQSSPTRLPMRGRSGCPAGAVLGTLLAVQRGRWKAVLAGGFIGATGFALSLGTTLPRRAGLRRYRGCHGRQRGIPGVARQATSAPSRTTRASSSP